MTKIQNTKTKKHKNKKTKKCFRVLSERSEWVFSCFRDQRKSCLPRKTGFTLIEVTVTVMLFSILMVVGTGAVLNTNALHQRTQKLRTAVDNLSFIMDDMARTMRTGFDYGCVSPFFTDPPSITLVPTDCPQGNGAIALFDQDGNLIIYQIRLEQDRYIIEKSKEGGLFLTLTVPDIKIDSNTSGFTVIGAESQEDGIQPRVIIRLSGTVTYKDIDTTFNLQTTVSQRLLDI